MLFRRHGVLMAIMLWNMGQITECGCLVTWFCYQLMEPHLGPYRQNSPVRWSAGTVGRISPTEVAADCYMCRQLCDRERHRCRSYLLCCVGTDRLPWWVWGLPCRDLRTSGWPGGASRTGWSASGSLPYSAHTCRGKLLGFIRTNWIEYMLYVYRYLGCCQLWRRCQ